MKDRTMRPVCDFSDQEQLCQTLNKAGVPHDPKWRTLILFMRGLRNYHVLTDTQKSAIQELVVNTLKEKNFSDENYHRVVARKQEIINGPCHNKLQSALAETAAMVKEFRALLTRRSGDVSSLENVTVKAIQENSDPDAMIAQIRQAFRELAETMQSDAASLERISRTDSLTNLNNRRAFDEFMESAVQGWLQHRSSPLTLMMIDIDHFKLFNDNYGHRIGDQALATVASLIRRQCEAHQTHSKLSVFPARYGGEEFAVVMPGVDEALARDWAEELRGSVARYNFIIRDADGDVLKRGIHITVSIGVGSMQESWRGAYVENLIDAADKALYAAKAAGRNQVVVHGELIGR